MKELIHVTRRNTRATLDWQFTFWRDYWRAEEYGITIHLHTDVDGRVERGMLLSEVVGGGA